MTGEILEHLLLMAGGLVAGISAGIWGIGGGVIMVPLLVLIGEVPVVAVGTSSMAVLITSLSGSLRNFFAGELSLRRVLSVGAISIFFAQAGVAIANALTPSGLIIAFLLFMIGNIFLARFRKKVETREISSNPRPIVGVVTTGACGGLFAGLFGVGGGIIMVPLMILFLQDDIKTAVRTSLGIIVITALAASVGHFFRDSIDLLAGFYLGIGGLVGAQIGTRLLTKLSSSFVSISYSVLRTLVFAILAYEGIKRLIFD